MAEAVDGEIVGSDLGAVVRCEPLTVVLPLDRDRLARVPGHPPPDVPLVCLDTETTGLATAAGTMAFLVGLGWWEADRFRQAPAAPAGPAERAGPARAARSPHPPERVAGDVQRPRLRLAAPRRAVSHGPTRPAGPRRPPRPAAVRAAGVQASDDRCPACGRSRQSCSASVRHEDVDGWEIPGRYLDFLRSGLAEPLLAVVRHNREDVRSLARLLVHVEAQFADEDGRRLAHRGDLAGLARAYSRERRLEEALGCLDTAIDGSAAAARPEPDDDLWWTARRPVDYGGKPRPRTPGRPAPTRLALDGRTDPRRAGPAPSASRPICRCRRGVGGAGGGHRADRGRRLGRGRQAPRASARRSCRCVRGRGQGPRSRRPPPADGADRPAARSSHRDSPGPTDAAARRPALTGGAGQLTPLDATGGTRGTRGSGSIDVQVSRTQSRSGSNEQAIVRRSPASALR